MVIARLLQQRQTIMGSSTKPFSIQQTLLTELNYTVNIKNYCILVFHMENVIDCIENGQQFVTGKWKYERKMLRLMCF